MDGYLQNYYIALTWALFLRCKIVLYFGGSYEMVLENRPFMGY